MPPGIPLKVKSVPLSSERENLNIDSHDSGYGCCKPSPSKMHTPQDQNWFWLPKPEVPSSTLLHLNQYWPINCRLYMSLGQRCSNALLFGSFSTTGDTSFQLRRGTSSAIKNQQTLPASPEILMDNLIPNPWLFPMVSTDNELTPSMCFHWVWWWNQPLVGRRPLDVLESEVLDLSTWPVNFLYWARQLVCTARHICFLVIEKFVFWMSLTCRLAREAWWKSRLLSRIVCAVL